MMKNWQKILMAVLLLVGSLIGAPVHAGVEDFYFDSMEVDYYLSKDEEGHSVMRVKEVLSPVFPEIDQNRGIIRAIPTTYRGHSVDFQLGEVLRNGVKANIYKDTTESSFRILTIRDSHSDSFLHGLNTYEINYTLRDVTHRPNDADIDEFYWDINGTDWKQSFDRVVARVHLDESVRDARIDGQMACYTGAYGASTKECFAEVSDDGSVVTFTTTNVLLPQENLTVAIGFKVGTFEHYKPSLLKVILACLIVIMMIGAVAIGIWGILKRRKLMRAQRITTYPAEYLPAEGYDVFQNSVIFNNFSAMAGNIVAAGLIDLAVRHKVKIIERQEKSFFKQAKFGIEILTEDFTEREMKFLRAIFDKEIKPDTEYEIKTNDYSMPGRLRAFDLKVTSDLKKTDLYDKPATEVATKILTKIGLTGIGISLAGLALTVFNGGEVSNVASFLTSGSSDLAFVVLILVGLASETVLFMGFIWGLFLNIIVASLVTTTHILTQNGLMKKMHLLGLKKYIAMAESERLAFHQSVDTAGRDAQNKVVLYERLLPYAIMFGLEKTWSDVLKEAYADSHAEPDWYSGRLGMAYFASSLNSFSQTSSYASTAGQSSGSSGSGGGGFSGGGGGGGGGGGC